MSGRRPDPGDARLRTKALICATFHIAWSDYGSLTRREHRALVRLLAETADARNPDPDPPPPAPPGLQRVC